MVNCKGLKSPSSLYYMTSIVSLLYAVISTVGNILLASVILIDPRKKLRKVANLWLINGVVAGLILGGVIDSYRFYSNYLRAIGKNVKIVMPASATMGKLCHIYLICALLVYVLTFFASLLEQFLCITYDIQLSKKKSFIAFGCVSIIIWIIGHVFGLQVYNVSYSKLELPVNASTAALSAVGMIFSYLFVYRRVSNDIHKTGPPVKVAQKDFNATNNAIGLVSLENENPVKESSTERENVSRTNDVVGRKQKAKALCLTFLCMFLWTGAVSFILIALDNCLYSTCFGYFFMKHCRTLFMVSVVVWSPYIHIVINTEIRRGVLALVRWDRNPQVAPE